MTCVFEALEQRTLLTSYYVPLSIPTDFSRDVTEDLQDFFDSVPDGTAENVSQVIFPSLSYSRGTVGYKIEDTLELNDRHYLEIVGNDAILQATRPLVVDNGCDDTFTDAWGELWLWDGVEVTQTVESGAGKITPTSPPEDWATGIAFINKIRAPEADLTCTFKADSSDAKFGLTSRYDKNDTDTYYYANIEVGQQYIRIAKVVDGTETQIGYLGGQTSVSANTNYNVRFQVFQTKEGETTLKARYWVTGQSEPETWMVSCTDSTSKLQNVHLGRSGMWFGLKGSGSVYVDDFTVNEHPHPGSREHVQMNNCSHITIEDLVVIGASSMVEYDPLREGQHAYEIHQGSSYILLDSVEAYDVYGDQVYICGQSHHVTVQDSYFDAASRQGIAPCDAHDILVTNTRFGNTGRSTIDCEPLGAWDVSNVRIMDCTTAGSLHALLTACGAKGVNNVLLSNITNTEQVGNPAFKIKPPGAYRRANFAIVNCDGLVMKLNNGHSGFEIDRINGLLVGGNSQTYPEYYRIQDGVTLTSCAGAIVAGNALIDCEGQLVEDIDSSAVWDTDNTTEDDPTAVTMTELAVSGCYGFSMPYNAGGISNGHIYVIARYVDSTASLSFNGLVTTDRMCAVIVDSSDDYVEGWSLTSGSASTYDSTPLPLLGLPVTRAINPASQYAAAGQSVTFNLCINGTPPFTYQWQNKPSGGEWADIQGATNPEYTFTAASGDDLAEYRCAVDNDYGAPINTLSGVLHIVAAAAPTLTLQPASASLVEGNLALLTVAAEGSQGPLSYQWKKGGQNISGATASTYAFTTSAADSGSYTCVVTNPTGGTTSNAATLTVKAASAVSETWTGDDEDPWPSCLSVQVLSGTPNTLTIDSNTGKATGASCKMNVANNTALFENVVQQVSFKANNNGPDFGLKARLSDDDGTYYFARADVSSQQYGKITIYKHVPGQSDDDLAEQTLSFAVNGGNWYLMKFHVCTHEGVTDLKAKVWRITDEEPSSWDVETTDDTGILQGASGRAAVWMSNSGNRTLYVDDYSASPLTGVGGGVPDVVDDFNVAASSSTSTYLSWFEGEFENGYTVQRSASGTTWADVASLAADTENMMDGSLSASTLYYYRACAYNNWGLGEYSDAVAVGTMGTPATPTDLAATAVSQSQIDLTWTDNAVNEDGYKIERSPNGTSGWTEVGIVEPDVAAFSDTGLSQSTTYYYRVYAYTDTVYGNSSYSNIASASTLDVTPPTVTSVAINMGNTQRSKITTLAVQFSEAVNVAKGDLTVMNRNTSTPVDIGVAGFSYDGGSKTATWDLSTVSLANAYYAGVLSAAGITDLAGNPLDGDGNGTGGDDYTYLFLKLSGDANGDGAVNVGDLGILGSHYGQIGPSVPGDLNLDGAVNVGDLGILGANYGTTLTPPPPAGGEVRPQAGGAAATLLAVQPAASIDDAAGNHLDGDGNGVGGDDYKYLFFKLAGAANVDAAVDVGDLGILGANYGVTLSPPPPAGSEVRPQAGGAAAAPLAAEATITRGQPHVLEGTVVDEAGRPIAAAMGLDEFYVQWIK